MDLRGERVLLRRGVAGDVPALIRILNEPGVSRWWGALDEDDVREQFINVETGFVIEVDGSVAGAIQFEEEEDPMYRHAGIDIFLSRSRQGKGLGAEAVRVLAEHLVRGRGHHRLTIDPAADNAAAIRAYGKVGFRRVGVMRKYERGPDGSWRDGLLMELIAEELPSFEP